MALIQSVGTLVGVVGSWPATDDQSGYEALSFTNVGEMSSYPPATGTYDVATFDDLSTGTETKLIDMLRAGEGTLTLGMDDDDGGQSILETAHFATTADGKKVSLKMTLKSGKVYYRKGVVTSYQVNIAGGQVVQAETSIAFSGAAVKVDAP